jgi:hypothetical protein
VECAIGAAPFELAPSEQVLQVRAPHALWLKERLLNLAIARLPPDARKVAWLDADVLFADPAWAQVTSALLERWPVAQPYSTMARLPQGQAVFAGLARRSFACQLQRRPESARLSARDHGRPGLAWAARRDLIERHGLYDAAIVGGGDELFAHAASGGLASLCVRRYTGARLPPLARIANAIMIRLPRGLADRIVARWQPAARPSPRERFFAHYLDWARRLHADIQGRIGCAQGVALHLWHGDYANRRYADRNMILQRHAYDPALDLRLNAAGVWEWASAKPGLRREVADYFLSRREDG